MQKQIEARQIFQEYPDVFRHNPVETGIRKLKLEE
jgi:hypothetical protein